MPDRFANHAASLDSPAASGFAITPSDGADLAEVTRAVYVGTAGNLAVTTLTGEDLLFVGVPGGTFMPVRLRRIKATGTTASAMVGLV